jgi:hypothetical protein
VKPACASVRDVGILVGTAFLAVCAQALDLE